MLLGLAAILSIPLGIVAIVTGIIALRRHIGKGMAIAGIIMGSIGIAIGLLSFLLVFMAVPALQRNQSDTQAQNDVSAAASEIVTFQSNNKGSLPSEQEFSSETFKSRYLSGNETQMEYIIGTDCSGKTGERLYSVSTTLKNGKSYCVGS